MGEEFRKGLSGCWLSFSCKCSWMVAGAGAWLTIHLTSGTLRVSLRGLCAWTGLDLLIAWWPQDRQTAYRSAEGLKREHSSKQCGSWVALDDDLALVGSFDHMGSFLLNSTGQSSTVQISRKGTQTPVSKEGLSRWHCRWHCGMLSS